jgi:hypothetical protein
LFVHGDDVDDVAMTASSAVVAPMLAPWRSMRRETVFDAPAILRRQLADEQIKRRHA